MDSLGVLLAAALILGETGKVSPAGALQPPASVTAPAAVVGTRVPAAGAAPEASGPREIRPAGARLAPTKKPRIESPPPVLDSGALDWREGVQIDPDLNTRIQSHPFGDLGVL